MTRPRRPRAQAADITAAELDFLFGRADMPFFADWTPGELWARHRDAVLAAWVLELPGTRPPLWWTHEAPRSPPGSWPGCFFDGTLPEPRIRLGGTGTPAHEVLAHMPAFERGVPRSWVQAFDVAYYNGRARDMHGRRIGTEFRPGHFPHLAVDDADPPVFESEATYLDRRGLFLPGERKRVPAAGWLPSMLGGPVPALPDDGEDA